MAKMNKIIKTERNENESCVNYVGSLHKKAGQFKEIRSNGQLVKQAYFTMEKVNG